MIGVSGAVTEASARYGTQVFGTNGSLVLTMNLATGPLSRTVGHRSLQCMQAGGSPGIHGCCRQFAFLCQGLLPFPLGAQSTFPFTCRSSIGTIRCSLGSYRRSW